MHTPIGVLQLVAHQGFALAAYFEGQQHGGQIDWVLRLTGGAPGHSKANEAAMNEAPLSALEAFYDCYFMGAQTTLGFQQEQQHKKQLQKQQKHCMDALQAYLPALGTPWQQQVWRAMASIPYGQTQAYGALAKALGRPTAARAVAHAVARNPFIIVWPCHRVLGVNGAMTGFAAGLERKAWLLAHEHCLQQGINT